MFFVPDTNVVLSGLLFPKSKPSRCLQQMIALGTIAISDAVLEEYWDVLSRPKFDKYLDQNDRLRLLNNFLKYAQEFTPQEIITDSRDSKDNKFLEVALAANATCLVTGDPHLLELHPFRGIPIVNAASFLQQF